MAHGGLQFYILSLYRVKLYISNFQLLINVKAKITWNRAQLKLAITINNSMKNEESNRRRLPV